MSDCLSCNIVREGSGGITYSYAAIGVLCPSCEWEAEMWWQRDEEERRAALPEAERIKEEIADRWLSAQFRLQNYWPRPGEQPPF